MTRHLAQIQDTSFGTTKFSSGVADGTLTYVTVGSTAVKISVAAGDGFIRTTNDQQGELIACHWAASTDLYTFSAPAAGQENVIFIGIEYSAGTVAAVAKTAFTDWNWYSNFPLARCSYDGTTMRILNAYAHAEDTANLTRKWMRLNFPFHREEAPEGSGGLELSVSLRALAMTAGKIWHGFNNYSISAVASGSAFDTHYKKSGGGFNSTIGVTSYPNTQYDNGSGTLQDLTAAKYGTLWVYLDISDGSLDVIYGAVNAVSVALAQADTTPTTPAHLQYHGRLIGRIIFKKSDPSPTLVESAWTQQFASTTVGDHSLLTNLLGTSPYYHLPTPTAPAANLMNVAGIVNGETDWSNKAIFDATNPAAIGTTAPGTALTAAHRDHVHSAVGRVIAITNTNDIFQLTNVGSSGWTGTINGAPVGAVVTYTNVSGNKNTLVPAATTQLGKQRLYNTTRGTNYLISDSNGTTTVTMTATPTGWQSGDTITTLSPTVNTAGWVDIEITSGECLNASAVFMATTFFDTTTAGLYLQTHPFAAFVNSKIISVVEQVINVYITTTILRELTSNCFSLKWTAGGAATCQIFIRQTGYTT